MNSQETATGQPDFVTRHAVWNRYQRAAYAALEGALDDVQLVRVAFCDPHGLLRSKTVTTAVFREVLRNGMDFSPGPLLIDTGHALAVDFLDEDPGVGVPEIVGAGDFVVVPDPRTFRVLPGVEPRTAWVICDEFLRDGSPHPLSTRRVLHRVCERYEARRLTPIIGLEVEWYLTLLMDGPPGHAGNGFGLQGAAPKVQAINAGYQFNLDEYSSTAAHLTGPLAMMLADLGLPLRSMEHESGPGQLEFTFDPMPAMEAADAMLMFRTFVKQMCRSRGYHASFMAQPALESFDPSGWHLHQSAVDMDSGQNIFAPLEPDLGSLSTAGTRYLSGVLERARDFCLLAVPTVNGYRRFIPDNILSPTYIGHAVENRNVLVRILGQGPSTHIENRIGEPCANPYLYIAAQLSAGLAGLDGDAGVSPSPAPAGEGEAPLPASLREALELFRKSETGAALLGRELASTLVKLKASEVERYESWATSGNSSMNNAVTEWEHREYFEVF